MHPRFRIAGVVLLAALDAAAPVWAGDVYAFTDADGSVVLSNVPTDPRYTVLVTGEDGAPAAAGAAPSRRTGPRLLAKGAYAGIIEQVSRAYGVESALLHAVVTVESRYDPKAVSPKGAVGLMQLMPDTARRYGVRDAFDPLQNLEGGARYLRDLLRLFDNDIGLALAAYNAGEGAVIRHGKRIPPYGETRRYVPQVLDYYRRYREAS